MDIDVKALGANSSAAGALLKTMSNERRLMILCYLTEGEKTVSELQQLIRISQSALSQHLARLRRGNVVATRREAQKIYYSISSKQVLVLLQGLQQALKS